MHSYKKPGNYTVILTIKDNDNLNNSITTKAVIIDKEAVIEPEEREIELPLSLLIFLIIVAIVTIIILTFYPRRYQFTLMVEKVDLKKKKKNKFISKIARLFNKTSKNVDKNKDKNINIKIDNLLSKSNKK